MSITLHIPGPLRPYCGNQPSLTLAATTVRGLLGRLEEQHPSLYRGVCDETNAVRRHINLFVNTTHIRDLQGLETELASGDVVTILPAVSGG
jgi:molybdopterin synthase sulfur carrier subunit